MARLKSYYEVLGVGRDASEEEIRRAYRRLAMTYHPDRNRRADAGERFKEVNQAYQVLGDRDRRAEYDRSGRTAVFDGGFGRGFDGVDDLGGFGDIFDAFFGSASVRYRAGRRRGPDLEQRVRISFRDAALGCQRDMEVVRRELCIWCGGRGGEPGWPDRRCASCGGSGRVRRSQPGLFGAFVQLAACSGCGGEGRVVVQPCRECRGAGRRYERRRLRVHVPPGVADGERVRLDHEGHAGERGGPPGDLYLAVDVEEDSRFRRDGPDIVYELPLSIPGAALGASVEVPTLEGTARLEIPAGTQSGTEFRVRGHGIPGGRRSRRGDLRVVTHVVTPSRLSDRQRQLLEELSRTMDEPPRAGPNGADRAWYTRLRDRLGGHY